MNIKELSKAYNEALEGGDEAIIKTAFDALQKAIDEVEEKKPEEKIEATPEEQAEKMAKLYEAKIKTVNKKFNVLDTVKVFEGEMTAEKSRKANFEALPAETKQGMFFQDIFRAKATGNHIPTDAIKFYASKAQNEGTDTAGGYLVPEDFTKEVDRVLNDYGVIRQYAKVVNMKSKTKEFTKVVSGTAASWKGEAVTGVETNIVYGQTVLTASKLIGLNTVSSELLEDAPHDVRSDVLDMFRESMLQKEDDAAFNGDGTATYGGITGILAATTTTTVTMGTGDVDFADLAYDDLVDLFNAIPSRYRSDAKWFMNSDIVTILQKLKDSNSRPLMQVYNDPMNGNQRLTLFGKEIVEVSVMPDSGDTAVSTKFLTFANLKSGKGFLFGKRRGFTIDFSKEASMPTAGSLFATDQMGVRVTERVAGSVHLGSMIANLKTAAA